MGHFVLAPFLRVHVDASATWLVGAAVYRSSTNGADGGIFWRSCHANHLAWCGSVAAVRVHSASALALGATKWTRGEFWHALPEARVRNWFGRAWETMAVTMVIGNGRISVSLLTL